jgi:hypothetical protein
VRKNRRIGSVGAGVRLPFHRSCYWSSTTSAVSPDAAWLVDFFDGGADDDGKDASIVIYVRAVRGDL